MHGWVNIVAVIDPAQRPKFRPIRPARISTLPPVNSSRAYVFGLKGEEAMRTILLVIPFMFALIGVASGHGSAKHVCHQHAGHAFHCHR